MRLCVILCSFVSRPTALSHSLSLSIFLQISQQIKQNAFSLRASRGAAGGGRNERNEIYSLDSFQSLKFVCSFIFLSIQPTQSHKDSLEDDKRKCKTLNFSVSIFNEGFLQKKIITICHTSKKMRSYRSISITCTIINSFHILMIACVWRNY